jgi:glucokinase
MSARGVVIGIDVGGTSVKGGIFDTDGTPLQNRSAPSPAEGGASLLLTVQQLINYFHAYAKDRDLSPIGVGVVVPGIIDKTGGRVCFASNLAWENLNLADDLKLSTGLPVTVGHDVRSASLAEQFVGGAKGLSDFILVTLGTGISCAITTEGVTNAGVVGAAGELGHIPIVPDGELCVCGQRGCLEIYASAAGIARRYRAAGGDAFATTAAIAERVGTDPLATRVWGEGMTMLGLAIVTLTLLIDPAIIILGGGLSQAGELLTSPIISQVAHHLKWREPPLIRVSPLGPYSGRVGAAILATQEFGQAELVNRWSSTISVYNLGAASADAE